MKIAGKTLGKDTFNQLSLDIARLPSRTKIDIPIFVRRAPHDGPTLLLMAGLHGDEINGIEILRTVLDKRCFDPVKGTVVCIPIINIYGFLNFSRAVPDGKDVNRSFPGSKRGSLASRVAYHLMNEVLPAVDIGIDFHTGGASRSNYPQVRCVLNDQKNQMLAQAFNAPFTIDAPLIPKSLRHSAHARGKNILVYEGGESLRFDAFAVKLGVLGVQKLMAQLEMTKKAPAKKEANVVIRQRKWVRAKNAGLFHSRVKNGQTVAEGQELGFLTDPFAEFKTWLKAPMSGHVIGLNNNPVVNRGDALLHLGR
ncbi:MAG: succinylglutamate desuccinylase/aspartoacylase family protein [Cyclobacteriaceae bacterium]|nr:succinylglutamate desuccinylase/aspartoacylase family protein [Cyclobacteriaceae bacterium]